MAGSLELQNAIQRMKCCLCKNVLSVPPIMILSKDGTKLKCGRCENNNDIPSICRNFSIESIAKYSSFPCIYKDCNQMIPWEEVESHEDACDKKSFKCPIYYQKCGGIVQIRNLEKHLRRDHKQLIHHTGYKYESYGTAGRTINFLKHDGHLFIAMISNDIDGSRIYVASLKKVDTYFTYNLTLSSTTCDDIFVVYVDQKIYKYNEMDHCLACMRSKCSLRYYPHTKVKENIPVNNHFKKIDLAALNTIFCDVSKIRYSITIVSKKEHKDNKASDKTVKIPSKDTNIVDECLKKQLLCPICMEYMTDKIYNCEKGHVLCIDCKIQLTECPSCRTILGESRCFPLENLADEVVFACLFSKIGCKFTGQLKLISSHEQECVYNNYLK